MRNNGDCLSRLARPRADLTPGRGLFGVVFAISRKYARLMGGDVTLTSSPGQGSVFRFGSVFVEMAECGCQAWQLTRHVISISAGTGLFPRVPQSSMISLRTAAA